MRALTRREFVVLTVGGLLGAAACRAAPSSQAAPTQVSKAPGATGNSVRLGHNRTWSNPALILGLTQGAFTQAGVDVVEKEFTNPADILQAIATGDLDAGAAPGPTLFTARQQGVDAKAVALLQGENHPPISYSARAGSGIKSVADLRGKKLAVNNYGGNYDIYLRYWLKRGGLDPSKDAEIIVVPVPSMLASLMNGQVDLAPLASLQYGQAQQQYPGKVSVLFTYQDVMKAAIGNDRNNSLVLVFGSNFVRRSRESAVSFLVGYIRAIRAMNSDPKKALDQWASAINSPGLRTLTAPPTVPNDGKVYLDSLQFDADAAYQFGYLKQKVDASKAVDNTLIDEAASKV